MRLVHLSDLHLGFRQFQRQTPAGMNQREADVARAFTAAVDRILDLAPDVVLIGGDVFHMVRPTNAAILHAVNQFSRLRRELPDAPIIIAAGNHDVPRSSETSCILRLFTGPFGIHVAEREPLQLTFPALDLAVLAVPDSPGGWPGAAPDPRYRYNVLLAHGEVEGTIPQAEWGEHPDRAIARIPMRDLEHPDWTYVALGHYHVHHRITDRIAYSGALDYTSSNPWGELQHERSRGLVGKGIIERDLVTGAHSFHPLPPTRRYIDLPPIDGHGQSSAELDVSIAQAVSALGESLDDAVVRLVVTDVPVHIARELDHKAIRDWRRRALHFQLETRRPVQGVRTTGTGGPGRAEPLPDLLRGMLMQRTLQSDIDRTALVELGRRYLEEAARIEEARGLSVDEAQSSVAELLPERPGAEI